MQWRRNYGNREVHCTPQVQDLYSLYPPSQRCGLCQNFKQTTLTTTLYKVSGSYKFVVYPPVTKTFRRAWVMECYRVDDTSPERAITGLSQGRVSPNVDWLYISINRSHPAGTRAPTSPTEAGTRLSDPGGCKAELTSWLVTYREDIPSRRRSSI